MASQTDPTISAAPSFSDNKNGTSNNSSRPGSELEDEILYTEEEERNLIRKGTRTLAKERGGPKLTTIASHAVDWALLPGLTFLYLLSFLDRANGTPLIFSHIVRRS